MAKKSEKNMEDGRRLNLDGESRIMEHTSSKSSTLISNIVIEEKPTLATTSNNEEILNNENKCLQEIDSRNIDKLKAGNKLFNIVSATSRLETTSVAPLPCKEVTNNTDERKILNISSEETNVKGMVPPLNNDMQERTILNIEISDKVDERKRKIHDTHSDMKYYSKEMSDLYVESSEINFKDTDCKLNKISLQAQEHIDTLSFHSTASTCHVAKENDGNFNSETNKLKESTNVEVRRSEEEASQRDQSNRSSNRQITISKKSRLSLNGNKTEELQTPQHVSGGREPDTYTGLQWLPDQLLDVVLGWLPFADVSRVGGTCRRLRRAAAAALRREMRSLVARVEVAMAALEAETTAQAQGGACMVPVVMRIILHTVLRVLLGEARVLRAVCWRYVRMDEMNAAAESGPSRPGEQSGSRLYGSVPVVCFPGGDLLDEFERLLDMVCVDNFCNDIDPEVVTGLFMRMERFLDFFEGSVEPLLRCGETPFGVKVADLLSACDTADCAVSVTHGASDRPFLVTVNFELRDASAVDSPPPFDGQMPSRMRLRLLARYLRNNVRWVNFFRPMRELWDLQDEIENRWTPSATGEHRDITRHHALHQVVMDAVKAKVFRRNVSMLPTRPSPPHLPRKHIRQRELYEQVVLRAEPPLWRETFSRRINPAVRAVRLGLSCNLELSGCDKSMLPLDLEFLDEERVDSATRHPGLSPQESLVRSPAAGGATDLVTDTTIASDVTAGVTIAEDDAADSADIFLEAIGTAVDLLPATDACDAVEGFVAQLPRPPVLQPHPQRLPPPMAQGEISLDWGPWLRLRRNYRSASAQNGVPTDGWDDYGASLRCGGEYGFRGEVRVTFPPRALSSIVTETVIQVTDTMTETNITSDRRLPPHIPSTRHICVFQL